MDVEGVRRVVARAGDASADLIRFLYVDHGGVVRGKSTSRASLEQRMATGIGLTVAMQAMNMLDELQPVAGMGPVGEVRIVPDPDTYVDLPYAPGAAAMMSDLVRLDGEPWEACPRSFLKRRLPRPRPRESRSGQRSSPSSCWPDVRRIRMARVA